MRTIFTLIAGCLTAAGYYAIAQVKSNYEYSTTMPYGTLDIRTRVSSTDYYYLQENVTFSFRESSPGVKTNKYLDMTSWESSAYKQGNLRRKTGTSDRFIMNYRLLIPNGYNSTYNPGYPMIVLMHGAVERANCYYSNCYHGTFSYTVQANTPPAPKTATHKLLNNDHNLSIGGRQHLDARNLAGTKLPNDPTLSSRAFPGFVLVPQMFNEWEHLQVQDMIRIVRLVAAKYKIDPDRIYIHGLSIGGYAVYEAMKRAPWLFAAALPMSSVSDADIFKNNLGSKVAHIPLWIFQGGKDTRPAPSFTQGIINNLKTVGASVRYSLYSDLGHVVWDRAYSQGDFFSWMLSKSKANIHLYKARTVINRAKNEYPKLFLAEGYLAYQWQKDGVTMPTAKSNMLTITAPGKYRARFSRKSTAPTAESQWNRWSQTVTITEATTSTALASARTAEEEIRIEEDTLARSEDAFEVSVYPNPVTADNINVDLRGAGEGPVQVRIVDQLGREMYNSTFDSPAYALGEQFSLPPGSMPGMYVLMISQGKIQVRRKVMVR